jgi:hypothetical protein
MNVGALGHKKAGRINNILAALSALLSESEITVDPGLFKSQGPAGQTQEGLLSPNSVIIRKAIRNYLP